MSAQRRKNTQGASYYSFEALDSQMFTYEPTTLRNNGQGVMMILTMVFTLYFEKQKMAEPFCLYESGSW